MKEKANATTISSATTQEKKKTFYGGLDTSNDWTVFFELSELKIFAIYPTSFQKSTPTLWIHLKGIENPC